MGPAAAHEQRADAADDGGAAEEREAAGERIRNQGEQADECAVGHAEPADDGGLAAVVGVVRALLAVEVHGLAEAAEEFVDLRAVRRGGAVPK